MKKIIRIMVFCMVFAVLASSIASAADKVSEELFTESKLIGLADEKDVFEPFAEKEELSEEEKTSIMLDYETVYRDAFFEHMKKDGTVQDANTEQRANEDGIEKGGMQLLASNYYGGVSTVIPTYTFVTDRNVMNVSYSDDGDFVFYDYYLVSDEFLDYMYYLIDYHGWTLYQREVSSNSSYVVYYLTKGYDMIALAEDFVYDRAIVMLPTANISATSVLLNTASRSMVVGNQYTLDATVHPLNASNQNITWSSSNSNVASVSTDGKVVARAAGSATITARTSNGRTAYCYITVSAFVRKNYPDTTIPTFSCVTGKAETNCLISDGLVWREYGLDWESHTDYEAYLILKDGWECIDEEWATDYSYFMATYEKNGFRMFVVADFENETSNIVYPEVVLPTGISLNITGRTMIVGNQYGIEATVSPSHATDRSVTWTSSNSTVATVDSYGVVTAKAAGSATITAKTTNGKTATCYITVKEFILKYYPDTTIPTFTCVTGVGATRHYEEGGFVIYNYPLDVEHCITYNGYLNTNGWVAIDDDDYNVLTFQKDGVEVTEIIDRESNLVSITYPIPYIMETAVTLNSTSRTMVEGNSCTLEATVFPANATEKTITWSSSNTGVAIVDQQGVVTAKAPGTAVITARTVNGKSASCPITVSRLTLDYYVDSSIETLECVTGCGKGTYKEESNRRSYVYPFDKEIRENYKNYLVQRGNWTLVGTNNNNGQETYSIYQRDGVQVILSSNERINTFTVAYADDRIKTETYRNGDTYTTFLNDVPTNATVVFACYQDSVLKDVQEKVYQGEDFMQFSKTVECDEIKVFIITDKQNMVSEAPPETVSVQ